MGARNIGQPCNMLMHKGEVDQSRAITTRTAFDRPIVRRNQVRMREKAHVHYESPIRRGHADPRAARQLVIKGKEI